MLLYLQHHGHALFYCCCCSLDRPGSPTAGKVRAWQFILVPEVTTQLLTVPDTVSTLASLVAPPAAGAGAGTGAGAGGDKDKRVPVGIARGLSTRNSMSVDPVSNPPPSPNVSPVSTVSLHGLLLWAVLAWRIGMVAREGVNGWIGVGKGPGVRLCVSLTRSGDNAPNTRLPPPPPL
jgi:hypothetical protein